MMWGDSKAKVGSGARWWGRIGQLLDEGQVFVVQVDSDRKDWTAAEVRAVVDSGAVILGKPGTKATVVEITKDAGAVLPLERRNGGRRGKGAGK